MLISSPTWDFREVILRLFVIESRTNIMADVSKSMEVSREIMRGGVMVGVQIIWQDFIRAFLPIVPLYFFFSSDLLSTVTCFLPFCSKHCYYSLLTSSPFLQADGRLHFVAPLHRRGHAIRPGRGTEKPLCDSLVSLFP